MNRRIHAVVFAVPAALLFLGAGGCASARGGTVTEKRNYVRQMRASTLDELYQRRPEARTKIENAAGYGVFTNVGSKIFVLATGNGFGIVRDNRTGKDTYMRMIEVGGGFGMGIKKYKAVFVFNDRAAMRAFLESGWEVGGDVDAGAKASDTGAGVGAQATSGQLAGLEVYQFTDAGVALSATAAAAKYFRDDELN
jgi:lipid-binding SYLF domain-containing protein